METAKPNIPEARAFAEGIHAAVPHQKLAYNLSPSFNWDAAGMTKQEMATFNRELGRLGFVWQVHERMHATQTVEERGPDSSWAEYLALDC